MTHDADEEIRSLRSQLQQAKLNCLMAQEMSQFKAGFLARVSHELRSPLSNLMGLHQLILADLCDDPAEERDCVAQAHEATLRLVDLLDRLIDVSKVDYGSAGMKIQPVQLCQVLTDIQNLTQLPAKNRNLRLQVQLPEPQVYVLADPQRFLQVLLSLVDTPIALMTEGTIAISTQVVPDAGLIRIIIEDDRPLSAWSEPVNLLKAPDLLQCPLPAIGSPLSPGVKLLMSYTLVDLMGGRLDLLSVPSPESPSAVTRLQCSIPLAKSL